MTEVQVHYVIDQDGNLTGVLIPIEQWRKIKAELEAAYLASRETMAKPLLDLIRQPEPTHLITEQMRQASS